MGKPCIDNECMAWENDQCIIIHGLGRRIVKETVEVPEEMKQISLNELTNQMAEYFLEMDPYGEAFQVSSGEFLINKMQITDIYGFPGEIQAKINEAERKADKIAWDKRIPEILKEKSVNELLKTIFDWIHIENKDLDDSMLFKEFWNQYDFDDTRSSRLPDEIRDKMIRLRSKYWDQLSDLKQELREQAQEEERQWVMNEITQNTVIAWVKKNKFPKLSKANLKVYLAEKKRKISPTNRQILYLEVNKKLGVNNG